MHWSDVFCDVFSNTSGINCQSFEPLASEANRIQTIVSFPTICTWKFGKTVHSEHAVTLGLQYIQSIGHKIIIKNNHNFLFKKFSFENSVFI